ncbi:hypothetical protein HGB25_00825 [Candidatus Saccharibacteria bacterium]|nr:hypothetical protein [Candidatus Saccharibacteria bacterium]
MEFTKETITLPEISAKLDTVVAMGGVAAQSFDKGVFEMVAVDPNGEAELFMYGNMPDGDRNVLVARNLSLRGVVRPSVLTLKGYTCSPDYIKPNDQIILISPDGKSDVTSRMSVVINGTSPKHLSFRTFNAVISTLGGAKSPDGVV